jgi:hypothetical protein
MSETNISAINATLTKINNMLENEPMHYRNHIYDYIHRNLTNAIGDISSRSKSRLPYEIWAYIFLLCRPHISENGIDKWWKFYQTICQVCHTWRDIAKTEPNIWKYLAIPLNNENIWSSRQLFYSWSTHIRRKRRSFTLSLFIANNTPYACIETFVEVMKNDKTINKLNLISNLTDARKAIVAIHNIKLYALKDIHLITADSEPLLHDPTVSWENTWQPPILSTLRISSSHLFYFSTQLTNRLTTLYIESPIANIETYITFLTNAVMVENLTIRTLGNYPPEIEAEEVITLPLLKNLTLYNHIILPHLLNFINTPEIKLLTYIHLYQHPDTEVGDLNNFINRHEETLETIYIRGHEVDDNANRFMDLHANANWQIDWDAIKPNEREYLKYYTFN